MRRRGGGEVGEERRGKERRGKAQTVRTLSSLSFYKF